MNLNCLVNYHQMHHYAPKCQKKFKILHFFLLGVPKYHKTGTKCRKIPVTSTYQNRSARNFSFVLRNAIFWHFETFDIFIFFDILVTYYPKMMESSKLFDLLVRDKLFNLPVVVRSTTDDHCFRAQCDWTVSLTSLV